MTNLISSDVALFLNKTQCRSSGSYCIMLSNYKTIQRKSFNQTIMDNLASRYIETSCWNGFRSFY